MSQTTTKTQSNFIKQMYDLTIPFGGAILALSKIQDIEDQLQKLYAEDKKIITTARQELNMSRQEISARLGIDEARLEKMETDGTQFKHWEYFDLWMEYVFIKNAQELGVDTTGELDLPLSTPFKMQEFFNLHLT